ncbi:MAG TPA: hypothetical protein VFG20_16385 [Planctomycetaceae bacterium]|nr:hypothetical protein [Planctomycetaceae bacterium]
MSRKTLWTAFSTFGVWCAAQSAALACPMCKMALETDDPQPKAYMVSILFMLGMIGSVSTGVGVLAWWINRREQRDLEAAGYEHLFHNGVNAPPEPAA